MKFGLRYCNTGRCVDPRRAIEMVQAAEEAGFESLWTVEHTVVPAGYQSAYPYSTDGKMAGGADDFPLPDPLIWMAYVAAATTRIKLATGIIILPQHNSVITAKQVATLDHLSGGRVHPRHRRRLAQGGVPTRSASRSRTAATHRRVRRTRCARCGGQTKPTFHGKFVRFDGAHADRDRSRQRADRRRRPLRAAARRAGRLGDGFFPARGAAGGIDRQARRSAESAIAIRAASKSRRRPGDARPKFPRLAALGVSRVLVPVTPMAGMATRVATPQDALAWRDTIARYAAA